MGILIPRTATLGAGGGSYAAQNLDQLDAAVEYCDIRHLHLEQSSSVGWVIRGESEPGELGRILGCVEEHDDHFELMRVEGGFAWSSFDSLLHAVIELISDASPVIR